MQVPEFSLSKLGDTGYRLAAVFKPMGMPKDDPKELNPVAAMMTAMLANHYISVSISGVRIEAASASEVRRSRADHRLHIG
jgi:hypothetical protein